MRKGKDDILGKRAAAGETAAEAAGIERDYQATGTGTVLAPPADERKPYEITTPWQDYGNKNQAEEKPKQAEEKPANVPIDFDEMIGQLKASKARTDEDIEQREKKAKREKLFAAIGDGLSAFHTAYSHARGVQPMPGTETSLSGKMRERYEKLLKEREANNAAYLQNYMKIMEAKRKADLDAQNEAYRNKSLKLREKQQERLEKDTEIKQKRNDSMEKYYESMAGRNYAAAEKALTEAEKINAMLLYEQKDREATAKLKEARAALERAKAETERNGKETTTKYTDKYGQPKEKQVTTRPIKNGGRQKTGSLLHN